jgi:enoyl-CoA hydratase/carnithine racemase
VKHHGHTNTFRVRESSDSLWRVTFDNPPLNLIDSVMIGELDALLSRIEAGETVAVAVFDSADPDFFLAHYDIAEVTNDDAEQGGTPIGHPHPWLTTLARLNSLPAVTISSIRGRARGAGSEFVIATDLRFASREKAVLGQFEIGVGAIPGGGPASRLPALVGRGRAFEILFGGRDFDGELAERYGYVNRALPDAELDGFVDAFATRASKSDVQAIRDIKKFVNLATLRPENELAEQIDAFFAAVGRPAGFNSAATSSTTSMTGSANYLANYPLRRPPNHRNHFGRPAARRWRASPAHAAWARRGRRQGEKRRPAGQETIVQMAVKGGPVAACRTAPERCSDGAQ